jgi:hypothetical protein
METISQDLQDAAAPTMLRQNETLASASNEISLLALALAILVACAACLSPLLFYVLSVFPFSTPIVQLINTLPTEIMPKLEDPGARLAEALHLERVSTTSARPGVVRVNNLAMLEALYNVIASGTELSLIAFGSFFILATLFHSRNARHLATTVVKMSPKNILRDPITMHCLDKGTRLICAGIMVPVVMKWLTTLARDAAPFN